MKNRVYTADMGQPPSDVDMGSSLPKRPKNKSGSKVPVKKASGGKVSKPKSRGYGCAIKG